MDPVAERVQIVTAWSDVVDSPQAVSALPEIEKIHQGTIYAYPNRMFANLPFVVDNGQLFGSIHEAKYVIHADVRTAGRSPW